MVNKNTEYEIFVAQIHQSILNFEGFENLRVEHDVTLTGKSGTTHQIDVFWEFTAAGMTYRTCIECKNYKSPVKKLHIAAFAEILRDIGNTNGVIATTSSFQKGAKLLAHQNNIRLVLVNYMLKEIHITSRPRSIHYENFEITFNEKSIKEMLKRNGLNKYTLSYCLSGDDTVFDTNDNPVGTFNTILNKHPKKEGRNVIEGLNFYINFDDIGKLLIDSICVDVRYTTLPEMQSIIDFPNTANAVIEDIVKNTVKYLHDDGRVSDEPNLSNSD